MVKREASSFRLHHNLGHPLPNNFANFLKKRHADPSLAQGALDFQCDSCAESSKGFDSSRPGVIHENLGFNQVAGMDTATWTSQAGKQFHFTHIIDEGTLFHVGAPVDSGDAESQIKIFERIWLLWAGPPQSIYLKYLRSLERQNAIFGHSYQTYSHGCPLATWKSRDSWSHCQTNVGSYGSGESH